MQACQQMCEVLIEAGIDHVFGIPGGGTSPLFNAIHDHRDKIRFILTRHEQAASIMADVYGRLTGKPGVLLGQGVFIGSSGGIRDHGSVYERFPHDRADGHQRGRGLRPAWSLPGGKRGAWRDRSPDALQNHLQVHHLRYHSQGSGAGFTISHQARHDRTAGARLRADATQCCVGRSGRRYATDDSSQRPDTSAARRSRQQHKMSSKRCNYFCKPNAQCIIAGNGVHTARAYNELRTLAEFLGAPVATSAKGKSTLPENHPLAVGLMGTFGQTVANAVVSEADVLLVIGCHLSPNTTRRENPEFIDPTRQQIIQLDIDPRNAGWIFPTAVNLVGDAKNRAPATGRARPAVSRCPRPAAGGGAPGALAGADRRQRASTAPPNSSLTLYRSYISASSGS